MAEQLKQLLAIKDEFYVASTDLVKVVIKAERNSFFDQYILKQLNRVAGQLVITVHMPPRTFVKVASELLSKIDGLYQQQYTTVQIRANFQRLRKMARLAEIPINIRNPYSKNSASEIPRSIRNPRHISEILKYHKINSYGIPRIIRNP